MAFSRISAQDTQNQSATFNVTTTYGSTPTQGNLLIAVLYNSDSYTLVYSSAGWKLAVGSDNTNGNSISVWYKTVGTSEPTAVTMTDGSSASGSMHLILYEYQTDTKNTNFKVDQTATANSAAATANSQTTGTTKTTTQPNQLVIAAVEFAGSGTLPSWTNSFTAQLSTDRAFMADKIVSTTGSYESTLTVTGVAVKMSGAIVAFNESYRTFKPQSIRPHPFSPGLAR